MHQICYLLAQVQKPGSDQGQVRLILSRRSLVSHLGHHFPGGQDLARFLSGQKASMVSACIPRSRHGCPWSSAPLQHHRHIILGDSAMHIHVISATHHTGSFADTAAA